jgi:putative tryptophan/tyrosine transport system substrate-binding protein
MRFDQLQRREFITLLGGAAAAWPMAARAQQALPVIGLLHEGLPAPLSLTVAFQKGLIEGGIRGGSSVKIENRWAEGQYDQLPALAADLIDHRVGIIVAVYLVAARAAKAATQTVPIVFVTGSDPIAADLVSTLNRPTSNLTGVAVMFTRLVLLCHKFWCPFRAAQHGQRESVVARAATNLRRIVAIEFGTWRSGRNGGSSGLVTFA